EDSVWRSQTINIAGSTTVLPIAETAAGEFMQEHSGVTITVQGGGSGQGYSQIISGVIDIGDASRPPKDQEISNAAEQGKELWIHPIALDAVCVVVNPSVLEGTGLDSLELTLEEVGKIYTGEYTNWNQLKSSLPGEEIYVVVRESGSGTRGTFEEYTMDDFGLTVDSGVVHEEPGNPAVRTTVEGTDYSIGYVGFGFLSDNMVAVDLAIEEGEEYVHPSLESIGGGQYPISRLLYFVTSEPTPESGSLADRFIDFVLSEEGQDIVESEDYLRLPAKHNYP
ncbi:MAG: PstS family phosphate ABC transporter substrate-binding protein, partial [Thermoproteota archaeon]